MHYHTLLLLFSSSSLLHPHFLLLPLTSLLLLLFLGPPPLLAFHQRSPSSIVLPSSSLPSPIFSHLLLSCYSPPSIHVSCSPPPPILCSILSFSPLPFSQILLLRSFLSISTCSPFLPASVSSLHIFSAPPPILFYSSLTILPTPLLLLTSPSPPILSTSSHFLLFPFPISSSYLCF